MYHLLKWESESPYVLHDYAIAFSITCSVCEFLLEVYHKNSNNIVHVNSDVYKSLLCLQTLNCNTCLTCVYHSHILLPHKPPPFSSSPIHHTHPHYHTSWLLKHHIPLYHDHISLHIFLHSHSFPTTLFLLIHKLPLFSHKTTVPLSLPTSFHLSPSLSLISLTLTTLLPPFLSYHANLTSCHSLSPPSFLLSCHTTRSTQ